MLGQDLLRDGLLSKEDLERALDDQRQRGGSLADALVRMRLVDEREVLRALARRAGLQYMPVDRAAGLSPDPRLSSMVPITLAEAHSVFPFRMEPTGELWVLATGNLSTTAEAALRDATGARVVQAVLARRAVVEACIGRHYRGEDDAFRAVDDPLPVPRFAGPDEPTRVYSLDALAGADKREATQHGSASLPSDLLALERENHLLRVTTSFSADLSGIFELELLADRALTRMLEFFGCDAASFVLTGDHGAPLLVEGRRGAGGSSGLSMSVVKATIAEGKPIAVADVRADRRFSRASSLVARRIRSVLCAPIIGRGEGGRGRMRGVLYLESVERTFRDSELELLERLAAHAGLAVDAALAAQQREYEAAARESLGRFLPPDVVNRHASGAISLPLEGQRLACSVVAANIRGLSSITAPASEVIASLNAHLEVVSGPVLARGGTLLTFGGDQVVALFGAPFAKDDHAERAVSSAISILTACAQQVQSTVGIAVGVATGDVVAGGLGTGRRMGYAALGTSVEVARALSLAAGRGELLVSSRTVEEAGRFYSWEARSSHFRWLG